VSEVYDEIVFTNPNESFFMDLCSISDTIPPPSSSVQGQQQDAYTQSKHFTHFSDTDDMHALLEAQKFIQQQLRIVKERFVRLNDEIATIDTEIEQAVMSSSTVSPPATVQQQQQQQQKQSLSSASHAQVLPKSSTALSSNAVGTNKALPLPPHAATATAPVRTTTLSPNAKGTTTKQSGTKHKATVQAALPYSVNAPTTTTTTTGTVSKKTKTKSDINPTTTAKMNPPLTK
jgi:hypothetical protein